MDGQIMATLAQYLYSISYSDKPQDEETEHFKEFRDNLLKMPDMSVEKLDSEISIESKVSRHKEVVTTPGTVYRRSHSLIRKKLKEGTKLSNIVRFLLAEVYKHSQDLGEITDEELVSEWKAKIDPLVKTLSVQDRFNTLLGIFTKILTLPEKGKTMQNYLGANDEKSEVEIEDETDELDENTFRKPNYYRFSKF
ncbi:hypothetical protein [Microcoleus sp. N9_A2]|uniref:hypothetical protein n=2 Tax=Microcoleus TaxID=44471 RepID=UPI00403F970A